METKRLKEIFNRFSALIPKTPSLDSIASLWLREGQLVGTNTTTFMVADIPLKGMGMIPYWPVKKILDTTDSYKTEFSWKKDTLTVKCGEDTFTFDGYGEQDMNFPKMPEGTFAPAMEKFRGLIMDREMVKLPNFCADDPLRPSLSGIHFDNENIVATDAHRLLWIKHEGMKGKPFTILRASDFRLLVTDMDYVLGTMEEPLYGITWVSFKTPGTEYIMKTVPERYPNYRAVVPKSHKSRFVFSKKAMLKKLDMASVSVDKTTQRVILNFSDPKTEISTTEKFVGKSYRSHIETTGEGKDISISFNLKFLQEVLKSIDSDMIEIKLNEPSKAAIFNETRLLMPMILP